MTQQPQPQPLAERIAAAIGGHSANISNGDGTVICNCGTTVKANMEAWREHRASTVLAIVQPDLDERDAEIRRLTAERDLLRGMAERIPETHMQFGVIAQDGAVEMQPCADWCWACKLAAAKDEAERLRTELELARQQIAAIDDEIEEFEAAAQGDPNTPDGVLLMIQILRRIRPAAVSGDRWP
ncbi:hypothetical protein [Kitasatospora sp. NPDC059571]|uniref:hypothetical protein n=1 Tax=Kitasatospora sp. NPDC059571 TaxID=3346871 RepID=UPI00369690D8